MKLLDQCEAAFKVRRLAPRTIQTYRRWVEEFLRGQEMCHTLLTLFPRVKPHA